jgi:ABC-2 type transport system permease protein
MMDKLLLKLVSALMPLLEKTGVDTYQLYHIVRTKLLMDNRRPSTLFSGRQKIKAAPAKAGNPWAVILVTLFMGLLMSLVLFAFKAPLIGQTLYFSMFMVLMALTLITDFTTVLLDVRDQYILLPRPVSDRTLAVSRILHISVYIFRLAILQGLAGVIVTGFTEGLLAVPLFIVQLVQVTFVSILLVNIVYLLLMKSVSPERFKDVISYFQIAFSIVIFGSYYLLPRLIDFTALGHYNLLQHPWAYVMPPVWIAALNEVLIHPGRATLVTSLMAIAGISLPVAGLWLVAKVLAPGFNKKLAAAATSDSNSSATAGPKRTQFVWVNKLANLIAPDPIENAGFRITWKLAARLREFKLKVYPALAYVPIYFLYFAINNKGSVYNRWDEVKNSHAYVFLMYLSVSVLSAVLQHISYTEKFKPAWIYYALPVKQPGKILAGMYKAVATLYYFPFFLLLAVLSVAVWGPQVINDFILAFLVGLIYGLLMALFMVKGLPFSKPALVKQSAGRIVVSLFIMGFMFLVGFGHYTLIKLGWDTFIWILCIPTAFIFILMMYYYRRQTWEAIEMEEF